MRSKKLFTGLTIIGVAFAVISMPALTIADDGSGDSWDNWSDLLYGAIGGGAVAVIFRVTETYFIAPFMNRKLNAKKKLLFYAKPFWLDCYELDMRLSRILEGDIGHSDCPSGSLSASLQEQSSIEWFTNQGYCVTSTAYLISSVAAWIALIEKDIVYLEFGNQPSTVQFHKLTQSLKDTIARDTGIWFYYVTAIGENLIEQDSSLPMTFSGFIKKLHEDNNFQGLYERLFKRINDIPKEQLKKLREKLHEVAGFLENHNMVPDDMRFRKKDESINSKVVT